MLAKGETICSLGIMVLLASTAVAAIDIGNAGPNSFDWFDPNAWTSGGATLTYGPEWNIQPGPGVTADAIMQTGVMDQGSIITLKPNTSNLEGDAIRCNQFTFGRYFWDHYGDVRVNDMNIVVGELALDVNDKANWFDTYNCLEAGREGWGWIYFTDCQVKFCSLLVRYCTEVPFQLDGNDPNNTADPTTWTLPWPQSYLDTGPFIKFAGNTTVDQHEPGYYLWIARGRSSDCWPAEPQKGGIVLSGSNVDFQMVLGCEVRLAAKGYIRYEVDNGGISTIHMANNNTKLNGAEAGGCVSVVFLGTPPAVQTVYTLIDGIVVDQGSPIILDPNMDPNRWTLARVADRLDATYTPAAPAATVAARKIFYNNSAFDGVSDDNAIAPDKSAYLAGSGPATFAKYISYSKGINGLMIDITNMAAPPVLGDVTTKVGNNNNPGGWAAGAAPTSVTTVVGGGVGGSDRVKIIFANNAFANSKWVQVTLNKGNVGLAADDVFYVGLAIGETGNSLVDAKVDAADRLLIRNNAIAFGALITNVYDTNRDKAVNATDRLLCRNNSTTAMTALNLINIP